jgi:hypothetical protein
MKKTLSTNEAAHLLLKDENAAWSYAGAFALVEYFEQLEEDLGETIEFCAVAIRCDFSEYESLQEWIVDYYGKPFGDAIKSAGIDLDGDEEDDEIDGLIRSHIEDHGQLIEFNGGVIVSSF